MLDIKVFVLTTRLKELVKYAYHCNEQIKRIDNLPLKCQRVLENLVHYNKQTFHVDPKKREDKRIVAHFHLEKGSDGYVTFPSYLWERLKKKYTFSVKEQGKKSVKLKNLAKKIFCSQITWWLVVGIIVILSLGEFLKQYIPGDWCLWLILILAAFILWVLFKASHNCRKILPEDIVYMGGIYCISLFIFFTSPIVKIYPEGDTKRILGCLTAFGPLIVGFAAAFFACTQRKVAERQHNLALLEKRLDLKNKFECFVDRKLDDCMKPGLNTGNLQNVFEELTKFSDEAYMLFGKDISERIMDLAKEFETLKTAIHYNLNKNQGMDLSIIESCGKIEKDISKPYGQITYKKNIVVTDMHFIMRRDII